MNSNKGAIHIHQDYAFTINNCEFFGCALHLHGCRFAFFDNAHLKAGGKVYSDRPGGEVQVGSSGEASQTDFMDDVSLVKKDSGTFTVGSAVSSTGVVTVTEGKLAFNAGGSWKKAASVVVSGGTLEIAHTRVFTKATDLSLSGNGVLSFADGVDGVLRVGWIVLDGTQMPLGRYCAEGNTAAPADVRRTSHIVGNGIVEACGRKLGMTLIVR